MVIFVTSVIDAFRSTQTAVKETLTTCAGQSERETDTIMDKFCVAMDNYFTLPHNEEGMATSRYLIDEHGTLVSQWMNNGLVLLVSMIHHVGKHVLVNRRRPRITVKNKNHLMKVQGNNFRKDIFIPQLVHHYNQWMRGVD
eukprot:7389393-Ditylum_brightwellii.AAC.1